MRKVYVYDSNNHYYHFMSFEAKDDYQLKDGEAFDKPKLAYQYDPTTYDYVKPQMVNPVLPLVSCTFVKVEDGHLGTPKFNKTTSAWEYPSDDVVLADIKKAHPDWFKPDQQQVVISSLMKQIAQLTVSNATIIKQTAELKMQNTIQAQVNAGLMKDSAELKVKLAQLSKPTEQPSQGTVTEGDSKNV